MMKNGRSQSAGQAGFTLIELLVVISILGLLTGLTLSAVQSSREAGRKINCASHLRQIGLALAGHLSAKGYYPAGIEPDGRLKGRLFAAQTPLSVHVQLLPYIEDSVLYNSINLVRKSAFRIDLPPSAARAANATALATHLEIFLCPSDPSSLKPGNNYRATVGQLPYLHDGTPWPGGGGVFPGLVATSDRDITDGLSQTVGFAERSRGSGRSARFRADRDLWYSGLTTIRFARDADDMQAVCAALSSPSPPSWTEAGVSWMIGGYADTLYNHVGAPNSASPDCSDSDESGNNEHPTITGGKFTARSAHPGGVHILLMDGSVKFQSQSINVNLWRALATRAGHDLSPPPDG